jgi:ABC-type glycerol-3-phosphate transport system substrate-binding protein
MKKVLSLVFVVLLSLAFAACSNSAAKKGTTATTNNTEVCVPAPGEIC